MKINSASFSCAKLFTAVAIVLITLCSCNGTGTQPSPTGNSHNLLIDPVAKGNGVWDYSVATDYYYGTQTPIESPSLIYDLTVTLQTTAIQFVFPQFPTLDVPKDGINPGVTGAFSITCPTAGKPSMEILNYYALPQLSVSSGITGVDSYLGPCVNGESVTSYYKGFVSYVVPVIDITQAFNASLAASNLQTVYAIADNVATIINNDPNAYGVAFDNEPAISDDGLDPAPKNLDYTLEQNFYGEVAYKLAGSKKYLFLFDAPHTANYLYTNGFRGESLNNIIIMQNLYDLDTTESATPAGPVSIESYTALVNKIAMNALSTGNAAQPPIRFDLPASATSTMWDYAQGYDMVSAATVKPSEATYINQTTLNNPAACLTNDATTAGTIDNSVLSLFICSPSGTPCPGTLGGTAIPIINGFLNSSNCVNYANKTALLSYFNTSLSSVQASLQANGINNPRYLGVDLYAWQIRAFAEIDASKAYFSVWDDSSLFKQNTQVFPSQITYPVWESFINWNQNLF